MWENTNLAEVKILWADKLGGFNATQLGAALTSIEERPYPPNLPEFLAVCRQCARQKRDEAEQAEYPNSSEAAKRAAQLGAMKIGKGEPNTQWAHNVIARWDAGTYLIDWQYSYQLACKALGVNPKPHPSKIRREAYRADVHG